MKQKKTPPQLTGKQRKFLRSLGHHLTHSVIVGREGISENVIQSCRESLDAHELIKVKLGQNCPVEKKHGAGEIAERTEANLVQLIGRTILLFRKNPDLPRDESIQLPKK